MFIKSAVIAVIAIIIIGLFVAGCSKHRFYNKSPEEKAEWAAEKISSELDLDEGQKAKLDEIKSEVLAKHQSFGGMKKELWDEMNKQITTDTIDEQKLNDLFAGKETEFSEMRSFMVNKFAEFHSILTAEQRSVLAEKMTKFHDRWHH